MDRGWMLRIGVILPERHLRLKRFERLVANKIRWERVSCEGLNQLLRRRERGKKLLRPA